MMWVLVTTPVRADCETLRDVVAGSPTSDKFMRAVKFALTGWDEANVIVEDRSNCVFRVDGLTRTKSQEIFYLNNVDHTKLKFRTRWQSFADYWGPMVDVTLVGEQPVYEDRATYGNRRGPITANHYKLTVFTGEYKRQVRAWKYVYAHGCTG